MNKRTLILLALISVVVFTFLMISKWSLIDTVSAYEDEHYSRIKTFAEALSLIKKNYVEDVKDKDLLYGAVKGMLISLDPHSSFMTPDIYTEMKIDTKGEFGGLGIQISTPLRQASLRSTSNARTSSLPSTSAAII